MPDSMYIGTSYVSHEECIFISRKCSYLSRRSEERLARLRCLDCTVTGPEGHDLCLVFGSPRDDFLC